MRNVRSVDPFNPLPIQKTPAEIKGTLLFTEVGVGGGGGKCSHWNEASMKYVPRSVLAPSEYFLDAKPVAEFPGDIAIAALPPVSGKIEVTELRLRPLHRPVLCFCVT